MTNSQLRSARFSNITVIQSLQPCDVKTGMRLRDDIEVANVAYDRGLHIELVDAHSKTDFINCLMRLANYAETANDYPIVHIEAHGSDDKTGIIFANGDYLSWEDIKPYFVCLNMATRHNLLVVLATCYGAHFATIIRLTDRAPCWGMVGPSDVAKPLDMLGSFSPFYQEWLRTTSGQRSVEALNAGLRRVPVEYYFTTAERFFLLAYKAYLKEYCTMGNYRARARKIREELKRDKNTSTPSIGSIGRKFRKTEREFFEHFRRLFFMIDLFPENEARVSVSYSDVVRKK
jgi:hypothetical protein